MSVYQKCDQPVLDMARELLCEFETHKPLLDGRVKIDFVFAFAKTDDDGKPVGDAIKHRGVKALGLCRKIKLKDRVQGRGDAEITIDGDWWKEAGREEQRALLDHELHHITVELNKIGQAVTDDIGRPKIHLRKHDFEFGWFAVIAERHGIHAQERIQAKRMFEEAGQYFWPELVK